MTPTHVTTLRLDDRLMDGLRTVKDRDGIPVSEQVRRAIEAWLGTKGVEVKTERKRAVTRKRA
jgi:Ribbon-helix-helix protein, copG family